MGAIETEDVVALADAYKQILESSIKERASLVQLMRELEKERNELREKVAAAEANVQELLGQRAELSKALDDARGVMPKVSA